jgi:hypothetical protein
MRVKVRNAPCLSFWLSHDCNDALSTLQVSVPPIAAKQFSINAKCKKTATITTPTASAWQASRIFKRAIITNYHNINFKNKNEKLYVIIGENEGRADIFLARVI